MAAAELVTPAEYARRRQVSRAAVTYAVRAGRISLIDGKIDPVVADIQWERNTRKVIGRAGGASLPATAHDGAANGADGAPERQPPEGDDPDRKPFDYESSRAKREHHEATLAELKALERVGQLVESAKVRAAMAEIARVVGDHLERLPDRLSAQITPTMSAADIHASLEVELEALRADLAAAAAALPKRIGIPSAP